MKKSILLIGLLFAAIATYAQTFEETQKIYAPDGVDGDSFGKSVSLSDTYLIVGNGGEWYTGNGAAYVFYKDNGLWVQLTKLTAGPGHYSYGSAVSTDGNYFVVGDPKKEGPNGDHTGDAIVYTLENGSIQEVSLLPENAEDHLYFGTSLTVNGDYIMVGAPGNFYYPDSYIFFYKNNNGTWELNQTLAGPAQSFFGTSTAMNGQYAAVGAPRHSTVYIYNVGTDSLTNEVSLEYGENSDEFGHAVCLNDDHVFVGSWKSDQNGTDAGSVYIFKQFNGFWVLETTLIPDDVSEGDLFGSSVTVSGDYLVIGAQGDEENGVTCGSVYIYHHANDNWELVDKMTASDPKDGAKYGCAVSMHNGEIVVGADDANGVADNNSGSVYILSDEAVTGISQTPGLNDLTLYPNPANDRLTIGLNNNNIDRLKIADMNGRTVMEKTQFNNPVTLDLSALKPGIYLIMLQSGHSLITRKLIKR